MMKWRATSRLPNFMRKLSQEPEDNYVCGVSVGAQVSIEFARGGGLWRTGTDHLLKLVQLQ